MSLVDVAAMLAALLLIATAAFQVALAAGLPLGAATMGGRAATVGGRLTRGYRLVAALSAAVLLLGAWIVLARAGLVEAGPLGERLPTWGAWAVVGFSLLNTVSNLSGLHPLERYGMSAATLLIAVLTGFVALSGP